MRVLPALALTLVALSGCGLARGAGEHPCTLIAALSGIRVEVAAGVAENVTGVVEVTACWNGSCRSGDLELRKVTVPADTGCANGVCSARVKPTEDATAFARFPELPVEPVRVTVTLSDDSGEPVVEETLRVTPERIYPNGRGCGGSGVQAQLVVGESGDVRVRE